MSANGTTNTNTGPGENAPLIAAVERLAVAAARGEPKLMPMPNGDALLHFRDANGDLQTRVIEAEPTRPRGHLEVTTVDGFAEAVAQLRSREPAAPPPLVFFLDDGSGGHRVKAVLNPYTADHRDYADHKVVFSPPLSDEWSRWLEFCREPQARSVAREFVEDNARDFAPAAEGCIDRSALQTWLDRLTLKVVREIDQADTAEGERTTTEGTAVAVHVTRLALRVHEGGPVVGFRCRWRARLVDGALCVSASIVNADEAERRVWLGPVPEGAGWTPLVEQVAEAVGLPVIV